MSQLWARVDDRLIHGQVVVGWRQHLCYQAICVVDDVVAADAVLRDVLRLATPADVGLDVCTTEEALGVLAGAVLGWRWIRNFWFRLIHLGMIGLVVFFFAVRVWPTLRPAFFRGCPWVVPFRARHWSSVQARRRAGPTSSPVFLWP